MDAGPPACGRTVSSLFGLGALAVWPIGEAALLPLFYALKPQVPPVAMAGPQEAAA